MKATIATTPQLLDLLPSTSQLRKELSKRLDPEGTHVASFTMLHNDVEVRAIWYLKLTGSAEPVTLQITAPIKKWNKLGSYQVADS